MVKTRCTVGLLVTVFFVGSDTRGVHHYVCDVVLLVGSVEQMSHRSLCINGHVLAAMGLVFHTHCWWLNKILIYKLRKKSNHKPSNLHTKNNWLFNDNSPQRNLLCLCLLNFLWGWRIQVHWRTWATNKACGRPALRSHGFDQQFLENNDLKNKFQGSVVLDLSPKF